MNFNSSQNTEIKSNKKSKIIIILMFFLLISLIIAFVAYSYYAKNVSKQKLKNEFFQKISDNDLSFFSENELYRNILKKLEKNEFSSSSDIKLSTTMQNNMFSELDLSKFEFNYYTNQNPKYKKYYNKISAKYAGNDLLTIDFLDNAKQIGVKSDEIVNKYVGLEKNNIQNMANKVFEKEVGLVSAQKIKNFIIDREMLDFEEISKTSNLNEYSKIVVENIGENDFSKKENVILTMDSQQINAIEYTVNVSKDEVKNILTNLSTKLENDNQFIDNLVVSNVQNFDEKDGKILEYTDNDSIVEVQGEEENFNASITIWDENATVENNVSNNTIENNLTNEAIVNNIVEQSNTTNLENTTTENITTNEIVINQQTTQIEEPEYVEEEIQVEEPVSNINEETENDEQTPVIEEEENLRLQGYISVNEDEKIEDQGIENEFIIGENYTDTLENIAKFAEEIDWLYYLFTGAKANITNEEMLENLQEILEYRIRQNNSLIVKMYVAEGKVVKLTFEIPETSESFDVQIISKADNEKYLNITVLSGNEDKSNGYTISLYKKNSEAVVKNKININKIYNSKISQKSSINLETKGGTNSKKYTTTAKVSYSDSDGEFKVEIDNLLNFDNIQEIEELNDDNCLFIDTLPDEELLLTRDAIKEKIIQVLSQKNSNLNIIDINNENSVVAQIEQNNIVEEDTQAKEDAKQALIKTISEKMGEYQNNEMQLKIEDLESLEVPGYEVNVSISSNLAIITVNGYKFKLDSDFNLSDS